MQGCDAIMRSMGRFRENRLKPHNDELHSTYGGRIMAVESNSCSFHGQRYPDGMEICDDEMSFGNCWVCAGGELEYQPHFITANYPERL